MGALPWTMAAMAVGMCGMAAWSDHRTGTIPNRLTVAGMVAGLVLGTIGGGLFGLGLSLAGGFAAALVPLILFKTGAMGGGDVKLFFALGALLGPGPALECEMGAFLIGAVQGAVMWGRAGLLGTGLRSLAGSWIPFVKRRLAGDARVAAAKAVEIRFAPAILAAVILVVAGRMVG